MIAAYLIIPTIVSSFQPYTIYSRYVDSMYSHNPTNYASGGNAAVLQLDAGDAVYVKTRVGKTNSLYGRGSSIYSTFSGYLIREGTN